MRRWIGRIAKALGALVVVLVLAGCAAQLWFSRPGDLPPPAPGALRVTSHNVHYILLGQEAGPWSRGDWERRKIALDAAFKDLKADIVAFQEMESFRRGSDGAVNLARDWLLERNPGWRAAASGDWRAFPSTQPILYRADRLSLRDQGWFFFSETPDVIYSPTFDGSYPAFTSWAEFADADGRVFRVYNLHTDWASGGNRLRSAALVRDRIAPMIADGMPVIVLGDFNALHGAPTMRRIAEAGVTFPRVPGATMHFDRGLHLFGAIDHIGLSPGIDLLGGPFVMQRRYDGVWPSDHHPVVVDIALR
ncbi:endonuclease/exonuclease/phosphatase family protein [Citreimonas salinaria]|uniref:Metal-dependent hydrolase, endonuclease/exonuclease/phosphatase family n=1 Tax=Citreimonas salinaria TaxID=321339 RepID=A0A1H3G2H7_9RHOB|nr:endonuclease/exonuclease/phosphatase family protein [Citreimonas salinaria]SDX97513.1 Metal-dependent hydrolase, endonuclease/exonuclease/phosphatase family [Citreimonas salinaria]